MCEKSYQNMTQRTILSNCYCTNDIIFSLGDGRLDMDEFKGAPFMFARKFYSVPCYRKVPKFTLL